MSPAGDAVCASAAAGAGLSAPSSATVTTFCTPPSPLPLPTPLVLALTFNGLFLIFLFFDFLILGGLPSWKRPLAQHVCILPMSVRAHVAVLSRLDSSVGRSFEARRRRRRVAE